MSNETTFSSKRVWITGALVVVAAIIVASTTFSLFSNGNADPSLANASAGKKIAKAKKPTKPRWADLTPAQREALAPLAAEWDQINPARKKKWLEIGNKVAAMKPEEKRRVQERISAWVKLTPEQRRVARTNYAQTNKLKPEEKFAQWQRYQQLTEEQKQELAAAAAPAKRQVANLPAKADKNTKLARSIKSAPKAELEKSLQPHSQPNPPAVPTAPEGPLVTPAEVSPV